MELAHIILALELIGTVAFAISGITVASEGRIDIFGAVVLGVTTACGGGLMRDIILGISPPTMFVKPIYALVATIVSLILFVLLYKLGHKEKMHRILYAQVINLFDAIGLSVFIIVGMNIATQTVPDNPFLAIFVGVITGIGGGILRDVLCGHVPMIFVKRIYALAAIAGALLYYGLGVINCPQWLCLLISIVSIVVIRLLAARLRWDLPTLPPPAGPKTSN